jgi:hypothetical protein
VNHVSHEKTETHQSFKPQMPSSIHQQTHQSGSASGLDLYNKPSFKVYSKAEPDFHLTIRDGRVILSRSNPSDEFQVCKNQNFPFSQTQFVYKNYLPLHIFASIS